MLCAVHAILKARIVCAILKVRLLGVIHAILKVRIFTQVLYVVHINSGISTVHVMKIA